MASQTYKFRIIARSRSNTHMGVGVVVTISVLAGSDGHLSLCGTLTMTEPEWDTLAAVLKEGMGDAVEFEDATPSSRADRPWAAGGGEASG